MADNTTPTFAQVLGSVLRATLLDVHTAIPGAIESYDAAKQTAEIRPLLMPYREHEEGELEAVELPVLVHVPIVWPGGGRFRLTAPLAKGDGVLVVFSEASIERWQKLGGLQHPERDRRRFHLADGVALPGLNADPTVWKGASSSVMTLGHETGPGVVLSADGVELGATDTERATEAVILGDTYRSQENEALQALEQHLTSSAGALAAAASSLAAAIPLNAVPIVGGGLAAAPLGVVVSQLGSIAAELAAAVAALAAFRAQTATTLSTRARVR